MRIQHRVIVSIIRGCLPLATMQPSFRGCRPPQSLSTVTPASFRGCLRLLLHTLPWPPMMSRPTRPPTLRLILHLRVLRAPSAMSLIRAYSDDHPDDGRDPRPTPSLSRPLRPPPANVADDLRLTPSLSRPSRSPLRLLEDHLLSPVGLLIILLAWRQNAVSGYVLLRPKCSQTGTTNPITSRRVPTTSLTRPLTRLVPRPPERMPRS